MKLHNFWLVDNPEKTLIILRDYYILKGLPIDGFNLTGVRWDEDQEKDWYNDCIVGWTWDKALPVIATTDPGRRYATNPLPNTRGVAHLKPGFYQKCYKLGFHNYSKPQFKHEAFIQCAPIAYYVDTNANFIYDDSVDFQSSGVIATNLHADVYGKSNDGLIGYASAGCQVVQDIQDLKRIISLYKSSAMGRRGEPVNYGLINYDEIEPVLQRIV